jgi:polysaccharide biosynthesis protein PslG
MKQISKVKLIIGIGALSVTVVVGAVWVVYQLQPKVGYSLLGVATAPLVERIDTSPAKLTTLDAGIQFHCMWSAYSDTERTLAVNKIAAAGFDRVRIDMGWAGFEPEQGHYSEWYTAMADRCIDLALQQNLEVLLTVHQTPGWANGGNETAVAPTDAGDFAKFMTWLAERYKNKAKAYEIWNEPDPHQDFFIGSTAQYVAMLKAAYLAIKASDPTAQVVLGGPSSNDDVWIDEIYSLGAKNYFDIMATHPYQAVSNAPPEHPDDGNRWWLTHFPAVLSVMQKHDDANKPVWFTEFGYSTHKSDMGAANHELGVSEQHQALYLVRAFDYVQKNYPSVAAMYIYNERDRVDSTAHINNFGIMKHDFTPKKSYAALKEYLAD